MEAIGAALYWGGATGDFIDIGWPSRQTSARDSRAGGGRIGLGRR